GSHRFTVCAYPCPPYPSGPRRNVAARRAGRQSFDGGREPLPRVQDGAEAAETLRVRVFQKFCGRGPPLRLLSVHFAGCTSREVLVPQRLLDFAAIWLG